MNVVNLDIVVSPGEGAKVSPVVILLQGYTHQLRQLDKEGGEVYLTGDARFRATLVQRTAGRAGNLQAVLQLGVWEWSQRDTPEEKLQLLLEKFAAVGLDFNKDYRKSIATGS